MVLGPGRPRSSTRPSPDTLESAAAPASGRGVSGAICGTDPFGELLRREAQRLRRSPRWTAQKHPRRYPEPPSSRCPHPGQNGCSSLRGLCGAESEWPVGRQGGVDLSGEAAIPLDNKMSVLLHVVDDPAITRPKT